MMLLTAAQLQDKINSGERAVYFRGILARYRDVSDCSTQGDRFSPDVEALASAAWRLYKKGMCNLVQQRVGQQPERGVGEFDYIAIPTQKAKRSRVR